MKLSARVVKWLFFSSLALILVSIFCLFYTFRAGRNQETVLAQVNGRKITVSDFNRLYSASPDFYQDFIKENKRKFLQDLINRELLFQEAKKRKIERLKEVEERLRDKEKDILVEAFTKEEILKKIEVSKNEVKSYYEKHKREFGFAEEGESFDRMEEKVKKLLIKSKEAEAFGNYLKRLRKRAKVRINDGLLNSLQLK